MNDVDPVAPATSFARAFAERAYPLWHATQAARVNNVAGLEPPATGHWTNNPHADDWRRTWFEIQKKWSSETGCPDGVFRAFNIDARLNAAYVVLGLLYGEGEFGRTIDIATRAGQDSDCNPATAAGILGTAFGYSGIPEEWKRGLAAVESTDFAYTSTSLAEAYELSYEHALQVIRRAGGPVLVDVYIDGLLDQSITLETYFQVRRETPAWRFGLEIGRHTLRFVVRNPAPGTALHISRLIWYGPAPAA